MVRSLIILAYVVALLIVLSFGALGTLEISRSNGFNVPISTLTDALYFTVITISTVGYGDVYPVTATAKLFTIVLIFAGLGTLFSALTIITGDFITSRVERISGRISTVERKLLRNHTILMGYGRTNDILADMLKAKGSNFIVMDKDHELIERLRARGVKAYYADATSEDDLRQMGLQKAKLAVIDLADASTTIHAVIVAKTLTKRTHLLVVASSPETERYLINMGVKHIVDPAQMAASKINHMIE